MAPLAGASSGNPVVEKASTNNRSERNVGGRMAVLKYKTCDRAQTQNPEAIQRLQLCLSVSQPMVVEARAIAGQFACRSNKS